MIYRVKKIIGKRINPYNQQSCEFKQLILREGNWNENIFLKTNFLLGLILNKSGGHLFSNLESCWCWRFLDQGFHIFHWRRRVISIIAESDCLVLRNLSKTFGSCIYLDNTHAFEISSTGLFFVDWDRLYGCGEYDSEDLSCFHFIF